MAETAYLAEQSISYVPMFNEMRSLTMVPTETSETVAMAAVSASLEQHAGAILLMSTRYVMFANFQADESKRWTRR